MKQTHLFLFAAFLSLFISCSDDEITIPNPTPLGDYVNGILVSNEGPFAGGSGSVSFISNDFNTVEQNIYQTVNNDNVGNILNSIGFNNDKAYLVANVSNRITIVDRNTFEKEGEISDGLDNPRHFDSVDMTGFVTNWGDPNDYEDDYVAVIDLSSESVIATIPVAFGPEKIIVAGSSVYVAHKGGYGHNNLVSVINSATYEVTEEIEVGDVPGSMVLDTRGSLWVLCEGVPSWTGNETNGTLVRIDRSNNEIINEFDFTTVDHPQFLTIDAEILYYSLNGNIYAMRDSASELPTQEEVSGIYFYNMEVHNGILYGMDAKDFASNGSLELYDMRNGNSFIESIPVGIIPGGVYFNE